ncbi:guanylate kinase [Dissulfurimicrobium hydrothermale]|uniref:guanylate kinase n=1 Tax=Dissulfurimicrobium hydrothermale TaxID=1750598 RepID=UPI001EDA907E|nr:guanylate kinase [Dissulfurimicrobium hydrothermale]UKL14121.1 guanylate kinase [Dissulfurimicrobium hydrothermale]
MEQGDIFVISAPSGAGKTTLCRRLLADDKRLCFSISHTTRRPRPGEIDGRDYFFVSRERFEAIEKDGGFLEWAEVHGNLYGTSRSQVFERLKEGADVLLDVDVQGARQIRRTFPDAVFIFILPPSWRELERRLYARGSEDSEWLELRLKNAAVELDAVTEYEFSVVNNELETALEELKAIILARRCRTKRVLERAGLAGSLGVQCGRNV